MDQVSVDTDSVVNGMLASVSDPLRGKARVFLNQLLRAAIAYSNPYRFRPLRVHVPKRLRDARVLDTWLNQLSRMNVPMQTASRDVHWPGSGHLVLRRAEVTGRILCVYVTRRDLQDAKLLSRELAPLPQPSEDDMACERT